MAQPFPGGIRDDQGKVAYLSLLGELIAVDLGTGAEKWRQPGDVEPIASSDHFLVTRRNLPTQPVVELRNTADGEILTSLTSGQLPGFDLVAPDDAIEAEVHDTPQGPQISWRSEPRYRGGAMPGSQPLTGGGFEGAVLVETATGQTRPIRPAPALPSQPTLEPVTAGPSTIAAARDGDWVFVLKDQDGALLLEARDGKGELRWQTAMGEMKAARAGPMRQ